MHVRRQSPDPVFVDRTGRRRRLFAATGAAGGVLLAIASLALVAGLTGAGDSSLPALPEATVTKTHAATPSATTRSPESTPTRTARPEERGGTATPATTTTPPQAGVTPSPTHTNNRRVPTNRPSKKA